MNPDMTIWLLDYNLVFFVNKMIKICAHFILEEIIKKSTVENYETCMTGFIIFKCCIGSSCDINKCTDN